ncbi:hypothetical protein C6P40_001749 [Pichia californica]|uniref:Zn(2)-C6 fungal-type domain-containing protein n=1 Tax=Pichia californica TaxID=460514 RepID=A0A9P6WLF6_9ASCO|nr:hypothetical protein C6P42_000896 [[Candida] californica]KAG0687878.1 hypothetical protein C6P40_001749 [[Candida] californica]
MKETSKSKSLLISKQASSSNSKSLSQLQTNISSSSSQKSSSITTPISLIQPSIENMVNTKERKIEKQQPNKTLDETKCSTQTQPSEESIGNPTQSNIKKKRFRRSYNCGPCKNHKIKCDMQIPCGNCQKYDRIDQCLKCPPTPPTYQQYIIKQQRKQKYLEKRYKLKFPKQQFMLESKFSESNINDHVIQSTIPNNNYISNRIDIPLQHVNSTNINTNLNRNTNTNVNMIPNLYPMNNPNLSNIPINHSQKLQGYNSIHMNQQQQQKQQPEFQHIIMNPHNQIIPPVLHSIHQNYIVNAGHYNQNYIHEPPLHISQQEKNQSHGMIIQPPTSQQQQQQQQQQHVERPPTPHRQQQQQHVERPATPNQHQIQYIEQHPTPQQQQNNLAHLPQQHQQLPHQLLPQYQNPHPYPHQHPHPQLPQPQQLPQHQLLPQQLSQPPPQHIMYRSLSYFTVNQQKSSPTQFSTSATPGYIFTNSVDSNISFQTVPNQYSIHGNHVNFQITNSNNNNRNNNNYTNTSFINPYENLQNHINSSSPSIMSVNSGPVVNVIEKSQTFIEQNPRENLINNDNNIDNRIPIISNSRTTEGNQEENKSLYNQQSNINYRYNNQIERPPLPIQTVLNYPEQVIVKDKSNNMHSLNLIPSESSNKGKYLRKYE